MRQLDDIRQATRNPLARNTAWMIFGQGSQLLIQGVYFILIGRALGPEGFGAFAGTLALVFILVPFAGWGSGQILVQEVARRPEVLPIYWGNALLTVLVSGSLFTLAALGVGRWLLPSLPFQLILALALAELLCGKVIDLAGQAFQALEQLRVTAWLNILLGMVKLIAAGLYLLASRRADVAVWGFWYCGALAVAALAALVWVTQRLGRPRPAPRLLAVSLREGWHFALGLSSATVYNDIDKTMLARLSTLEATGIYAAAYRLIAMTFVPIRSLLFATDARFFRDGSAGIHGSLAFARRLLPPTAAYGLAATLGLTLAAPIVPLVLGDEYRGAVLATQLLAPIVLLRSVHYLGANTLTGAGYQRVRSAIQLVVAGLNVALNLWLIPSYGWLGAAWTSLASDGLLVACYWSAVWLLMQRTTPRSMSTSEDSADVGATLPAHKSL
jgi:O-antigen/teichoic acid export membrane protein